MSIVHEPPVTVGVRRIAAAVRWPVGDRLPKERSMWPGGARLILVGCGALALIVPVLAWWDLRMPGRLPLAVASFLLLPGTPVAVRLFPRRPGLWIGLSVALSMSFALVCSMVQILTGLWSPATGSSCAAALTFAFLGSAWRVCAPDESAPPVEVRRRERTAGLAVLAVAGVLWWWATRVVNLDRAQEMGVLQAAPWQYWTALVLVLCVAAFALHRPATDTVLAGAAAVTLIVVAYLFVSVADGSPVGPTGFIHTGFSEAIVRVGFLPEAVDARFSWAGFFTATAALAGVGGLPDTSGLMLWHPLVITLALLPPMYTLGRAITGDRRPAWLGIFVLICANWVQQDYFSPQSVAFVIYLNIVALLVTEMRESPIPALSGSIWSRLVTAPRRTPGRPTGCSGRRFLAVELLLLALAAGIVVGHQLTPVALVAALTMLAVAGLTRRRTLWLGVGVLFTAWFAFGATDWWTGHLSELWRGVGEVGQATRSGVVGRVRGQPTYARLQLVRIGWTGLVSLTALVGWLLLRKDPLRPTLAILVIAPAGLAVGNAYGGEVLLRGFLYALPVLAVLAAVAIDRVLRDGRVTTTVALAGVLICGGVLQTVTRGLNVAFERTPADVLAAARRVLDDAPGGSTISPLRTEAVLQVARLGQVRSPKSIGCRRTPIECILRQEPDYLFLSTTREAHDRITRGEPVGSDRRLAEQMLVSGLYQTWIDSPHALVLKHVPGERKGAR
jgi:hypothetical protein